MRLNSVLLAFLFLFFTSHCALKPKENNFSWERSPDSVSQVIEEVKDLVLIGNIPGQYLFLDKNKMYLGYVLIKNKEIQKVARIDNLEKFKEFPRLFLDVIVGDLTVLELLRSGQSKHDVIYPGLIDLHGHAKQNMLPVWGNAKGQFATRFDWRADSSYQGAVSANMNAWVGAGSAMTCAAFRWNELQAMTLGATYLQGARSCDSNFSIHNEKPGSYNSKKEISSPTDIVVPADMIYVWAVLKPLMESNNWSYEQALADQVQKNCPGYAGVTAENINNDEWLERFKIKKGKTIDGVFKKGVYEECGVTDETVKTKFHPKFVRYLNWQHKTIAGKKQFLKEDNYAALMFHLGEGRVKDPYNKTEFQMVKLLGLDESHVSFIHGLGMTKADYVHMIKKNMGVIWSPYSNILLYGETLDFPTLFAAEAEAGKSIMLALGSDWTPTGSKSILEEVKLAKNYAQKKGISQINDERLYQMMTSGPAQILNHPDKVGTLTKGAMGSLLIAAHQDDNPFTNLVVETDAEEVHLVFVDGQPIYGDQNYFQKLGWNEKKLEPMARYIGSLNDWALESRKLKYPGIPKIPPQFTPEKPKEKYLKNLGSWIHNNDDKFTYKNECKMNPKVFVHRDTDEDPIRSFQSETGMNLDRYMDIQKLLAVSIMTQSRNVMDPSKGKFKNRLTYFPSLYSCNDPKGSKRLKEFVLPGEAEDEFSRNLKNANKQRKTSQKFCKAFKVCEQ